MLILEVSKFPVNGLGIFTSSNVSPHQPVWWYGERSLGVRVDALHESVGPPSVASTVGLFVESAHSFVRKDAACGLWIVLVGSYPCGLTEVVRGPDVMLVGRPS